jgi:membrane-bound metal-dependent hydrolase YbcI (DUF457 family)
MIWKNHLIIGFIATLFSSLIFLRVSDETTLFMLSAFGAMASLFPDIDHNDSKIRYVLDAAVVAIIFVVSYLLTCNWTICIPSIENAKHIFVNMLAVFGGYTIFFILVKPKHRGITHTVIACLVFSILVYILFGLFFAFSGMVGYLSHLLADGEVKIT